MISNLRSRQEQILGFRPDLQGQLLCAYHKEPFVPRWPNGIEVVHRYFLKWLEEKNGYDELLADAHFDRKQLSLVLKIDPFCCRVPNYAMLDVYGFCKVGELIICEHCGKCKLGGRLRYRDITTENDILRIKNLCFECWLFQGKQDPKDIRKD